MQIRCFEALAGKYDVREFAGAVGEAQDLGAAGLRILAWTWLTRFHAPERATSLFEAAVEKASEPERAIIEEELAFAARFGD